MILVILTFAGIELKKYDVPSTHECALIAKTTTQQFKDVGAKIKAECRVAKD